MFACTACEKVFSATRSMFNSANARDVHRPKPTCGTCIKPFTRNRDHARHEAVHGDDIAQSSTAASSPSIHGRPHDGPSTTDNAAIVDLWGDDDVLCVQALEEYENQHNKRLNMNKNELQATKTIDLVENHFNDTKSKGNRFKDIAVREMNSQDSEDLFCLTDILKYDCNKENDNVSCHLQQSVQTLPQNKNQIIQCRVCSSFVSVDNYNQHIETLGHQTAMKERFKDRVDFMNYQIFPPFFCATMIQFLECIKHDFFVLIEHIILAHTAVSIDIDLCALYREESSFVENRNMAEVKHFRVYNKELTKDTDVSKMYKDIVDSIIWQNSRLDGSLEELISIEISIVNRPSVNGVTSHSFVMGSHRDGNDNIPNGSDHLKNTVPLKPLQILRCKQCQTYVVHGNYQQHIDTIGHKMSVYYFQHKNIQIQMVKCEEHILSCLITTEHNLIDNFFCSIEPHTLELIDRVIKLLALPVVSVNIKMIALYSNSDSNSKSDMLGQVKSFEIKNEILSVATDLLIWFQTVSIRLKSYNHKYLKTTAQSNCYLIRPLFLDINFYETTNVQD